MFWTRLYRTYEELKPVQFLQVVVFVEAGLYRTYEELKPSRKTASMKRRLGLYRTYEELKL